MENKCLLDTELFDFFCEQFGKIKSHEIPATAVTLLKNNAKDNTPVNDTKVFNILKAYNQCVAQQHSMKYCYKTYNVLTTSPNFSANDNYKRSAQEILDNITKYSTTTTLRNMIEIVGDFNEGFIAINYLTQEQILCDIEWRLYVCVETESIPAETSHETIFHTQTNIIEGNEYKIECIIRDREYASHWCWTENIIWMKQADQIIYPNTLIHTGNEIPMKAIYPDTVSDENQYFYITTKYKASGTAFSVTPNNVSMYLYCSITDPYHWQSFTSSTLTNVTLEENTKIYFKTTINSQSYDTNISVISFYNNQFIKTTGGNIMSLVYGDNFKNETSVDLNYSNLFAELFSNCSSLKSAKHLVLPIEHVPEYGYNYMFADCSSLVYAPEEISATILEDYACENMFSNCTSLIYAPEILTVKAYDYAMDAMFASCESLKYVPDLHIMFCGESTCEQMFVNCTSLERAPKIPILTLTSYCCDGMFSGCENLKYIDAAFMDAPSSSTNSNWVEEVAATGTFVKNVNADWNEASVRGDNGVPQGWTVITAKPDREFEYMVEYIATDGNAYIDTGVIQYAHENEFIMSTPTVTNINFFGSQTSSSSGKYIMSYNTSSKWTLIYGTASVTNSTTLTANTKYKISGAKTLTITNLSSNSSFTLTGSGRPFASTYSTYLFAVNNAGTPILSGCNGLRCYRAKITNDSTLVVDYIPVRIGSKGYMYNRVTKSLVKNAGSGMFTPGPDIIPVEYLGSNGQAYIDIPISIGYGAGIAISTELIPVYTSSYTYTSIFAVTMSSSIQGSTPAASGVIVRYNSYSNNIITYSSTIGAATTNGNFMMQVGKHEKLILSTSIVISSYTYKSISRPLVGEGTTTNLRLFAGYDSSGVPQGYPIKICNFNVNITVADQYYAILTPVKLNNVGYMYNSITGELYGNIGSSSFTFGPEVFINITP